jgi:hypothetical protein
MRRFALAVCFLLAVRLCPLAQSNPAESSHSWMEVVLIGTGYPRPYPGRAGPSTAVIVNDEYFIVDAGRAVVLRLCALHQPMPPIAQARP